MTVQIAIDGPVASGKTAVGMALARRLGCAFLDTGLMYRAVAWAALERGVAADDESAVVELARCLELRLLDDASGRLLADGEDVTDLLRSPQVDANVSHVSSMPGVRAALIARQREIAAEAPIVMVGRDIGSVVLHDAHFKLFLTATARTRAHRRHHERIGKGEESRLEDVACGIERRDRLDAAQSLPAHDARRVDTDDMSVEDVVELAMRLLEDCR